MAFEPGELCCSSDACVLLDTATSYVTKTWDLIPHVTQISTTQTATTPKLVTSSTNGQEISACGTVSNVGTLAIACHSGNQPNLLCINGVYRIRWSSICDRIWNSATDAPIADVSAGPHFEATIRITSVPFDLNIAGNQAQIYNYGFDIVKWVTYPDCQATEDT